MLSIAIGRSTWRHKSLASDIFSTRNLKILPFGTELCITCKFLLSSNKNFINLFLIFRYGVSQFLWYVVGFFFLNYVFSFVLDSRVSIAITMCLLAFIKWV